MPDHVAPRICLGGADVKRRILLLVTDLEIGGTPTVVRELATRLNDPPRTIVDVACLSKWGPLATELADAGINVTSLNALGPLDVAVIARLRRFVTDLDYDTVFSFLVHANVASTIGLCGLPNLRQFQSIQTTQPRPRWHWKLQTFAQRRAEMVVVPSESAAMVARNWARVPAGKVVVIPNAVEVAAFRAQVPSGRARQDDSGNPRPLRVGFIGRLDPIKRVVDLVGAAAVLGGRATVDIFGDGPDRPAIEREIASAGVSSLVTLHGKIAAPEPALNTLDVLVLPSDAEGFGLVLIEAMAAGVAVIATDVPGIRDVIRDDVNGLLVPRRNPLALAAAIVRLMEDRSLRQRLIDSATEEVHARYDWAAVLPRYRELLGITESAPMLSAS
jgi:glycosyltransferase involved in cell wall biosynthesis